MNLLKPRWSIGAWDGGEDLGEAVLRRLRSLQPLLQAMARLDNGCDCTTEAQAACQCAP